MTDQEMRIAIAEACGWTQNKGNPFFWTGSSGESTMTTPIPDYPTDLNAMHEAETTLTHAQRIEYAGRVIKMVHGPTWAFDAITLSARQRGEAYLRTVSKWKD